MDIKVVKRNGSVEDFDNLKVARVVEAAGLDEDQANKLADTVEKWAKNLKQKKIQSSTIRIKVYEELKKIDKYSADLYLWYKKTQDHNPIKTSE